MNERAHQTLNGKLLRLVLGVLLLVAFSIVGLVGWLNAQTESRRLADMEQLVRRNIAEKAHVLVDNHALALRNLVVDNAFGDVRALVEHTVAKDPDIVYGVFVSEEGAPWAYASPTTRGGESLTSEQLQQRWTELTLPPNIWKDKKATEGLGHQFNKEVLEMSRPVIADGEMLGMIRYGFSTDPLERALTGVRSESKRTLNQMFQWIALAVSVSMVLGFWLVRRAAAKITSPLEQLTRAAARVESGEQGVRVDVQSDDELRLLGDAFNRMQGANEEAMRKLSEAMEQALEASRLKSEFLANMSHEIRTPMNGVIGMIRLILKMPLEGKMRRYAETVDASASALMTIINDVLDFSKMEAGKYTLQSVPYDPGLVVQEVSELLASRAYDKGLELIHRRAPEVPALVIGDPDRYRQILNNLVGNSIKFTEEGEIFIDVTVDSEDAESHLIRTVVQDTGIGIAPEHIGMLFDAFSQVDGSMVRKAGGTGLGLAISKRLVEMMGGQIGVSSEVGAGSKFWFTMRAPRSSAPSRPALAALPQGRRALVVEASRRWCRVISEHLTAWGLECDVLQDGRPALERLRHSDAGHYDIAVVGAQLRDISAEGFVKEVRATQNFKQLPLIMLTQLGATATLTEVEKEVAAQIAKPLRPSELYDCIVGTFAGTGVPAPQPRHQTRQARNRGKTILVVDDNDVNQFVASEQIEEAGFVVHTASNGLEAVEKVKQNHYAVVLMDCQMPVMDGYTAARTIREWEGNQRHVPIIALTAHAMAGERDKVLAAGMDDYLTKPLRAQSLERMLERYVGADGSDEEHGDEHSSVREAELDMTIRRSAKLVSLFVTRVPDNLTELDEAIAAGDAQVVREKSHKLKGSCLALGAQLMAKEAESLQHESEQGDLSQAKLRASTLWSQYDRVCGLLQQENGANSLVAQQPTETRPSRPPEPSPSRKAG